MKKWLLIFCSLLSFCQIRAQIIFENQDQRWNITRVVSNDDYTAISCDITILSNRGGCFDTYELDKNASIYISGTFGKYKLVRSEYEGYYYPWNRYYKVKYWNYYIRGNKNKVAHATFYFPRVPAGVTNIHWHFNGGKGSTDFSSKNYKCPSFSVYNIEVPNNRNTTPQTSYTEDKLREFWDNSPASPIEGIYNFISTSNPNYWGDNRHKLAIVKEKSVYKIIYLQGSNQEIWKEGVLKGTFTATTTPGLYKVNSWYLDNKMLSKADFYLKYHDKRVNLYDTKDYVETIFMKLYPENDIDFSMVEQEKTEKSNTSKVLKGNGSGFFIGKNIIATNNHVVKEANEIKVLIQTASDVKTYSAKVLCVDKVNDLALLMIDDREFQHLATLPYNIYPRTKDVGSSIFTMGYPMVCAMGSEIKVTDGIISAKTGYEGDISSYQISAPIQPGNSGGPMFDKDGNLVGITFAGLQGANNVGYAIKSSYLYQLMDAAPINIEDITNKSPKQTEFTDLIKEFAPYVITVLIY
jgi:S1-C subfamily serine protease